ncbi:MAG: ABC transporter ATP-binding protein [Erysipelotrichaceae bacterium]
MSENKRPASKSASDLMQSGPGTRRGPGQMHHEKAHVNDTKGTILRLWKYLSKDKLIFITAILCVIISSAFTTLASYMVRPIINGILAESGVEALLQNLIIMLVIYLIAVVASYLQARLMLIIAQRSLAKLREDLFEALAKLPLRYFDSNNNGDLMSRFTNDVDAISQMLSSTCITMISGLITFITTLAIMFYTNIFLTLVTITITPLFSLVLKEITKRSSVYYKDQQESIGDLNGYIEESIAGQKVIKVFNHEQLSIDEFKQINDTYKKKSFLAQFLGGSMGPMMGGLGQLAYTITAGVGGLLCVFGSFDIGGFTIFLGYAKSFSRPINDIFMQINTVFSALAGAERVFDVMDQEPERADHDHVVDLNTIKGDVVFNDVRFEYIKDVPVLKGISLEATRGSKIAFVGSTGAGKTTITNLLNRFYEIESGEILIDGINLKDIKKDFLRQNIATVLQDTHLFTGTVMENIRYGRLDASDDEVIHAAVVANADPFIRRLEHGYQTKIDGDGSNLSQGQRQLLNIARAAISKAPILVLDEATSSVDTRTEKNIEQALDRLMKERTTFVIAHRLSTVRNADTIIVLELGEIIERGNHHELLALNGKYHSLYTGASKLE